MKARSLAKKILSAALIVAVLAVAVPLSFSTASAAATVADLPTFDSTKHTDKTASLTIDNAAINTAWKDTGKFDLSAAEGGVTSVVFNGLDYESDELVYAKLKVNWNAAANVTAPDGPSTIIGPIYGKSGSNYQCTGVRPGWNNLCGLGGNGMFKGDSMNSVTYVLVYDPSVGSIKAYAETVVCSGFGDSENQTGYLLGTLSTENFIFGATAQGATGAAVTFSDIKVWTETKPEVPLDNETFENDMSDKFYLIKGGSYDKGSVLMPDANNFTATSAGSFGMTSYYFEGLGYDLSDGKYITYSATIYLTTNRFTEAHLGFVPVKVNGDYYRVGLSANGSTATGSWGPTNTYFPAIALNSKNIGDTLVDGSSYAGSGNYVGTAKGNKVRLRVVLTETSLKTFVNGTQVQSVDLTAADSIEPCGYFITRSTTDTKITDLRVYGTGLYQTEAELPPPVPDEPVYNSAYDDIADLGTFTGGTCFNGAFEFQGTAEFTNVKYSGNYIVNTSCSFVVLSRSKQADGSTTAWSGPRIGIANIDGSRYNIAFMRDSTQLLKDGGGGTASSAFVANEGEKVTITSQFNYELMTFNLWVNHEHLIVNAKIPTGTAKNIKPDLSIVTEGAKIAFTDYHIFGKGVTADIDDITRELKKDPIFRSESIPAMPADGLNYFQNIELVEKDSAGCVAEYVDGVFTNLYSDDTGDVRFVDAQGKKNINGLKNASTFVWRFNYTLNEVNPEYTKTDHGVEFTLRKYNLSTNTKRNEVGVKILENAIQVVQYKDDSVTVLSSASFERKVGTAYDIAILSSPQYTKVWVDGKLAVIAVGTGQYTIDLRYRTNNTAGQLTGVKLYTVEADSDAAIKDYEYYKEKKTGNDSILSATATDVSLASVPVSIWVAVAGFVAVLCLAGAAVVTVLFIRKRKG